MRISDWSSDVCSSDLTSVRFAAGGGAGFDALGAAFDSAIARARAEHDTATEQVRFQQALVDDMPIALLTIDARGAVTSGNKLARRLFGAYLSGARAEDRKSTRLNSSH